MPTNRHPITAHSNSNEIVQVEGNHSSASAYCTTYSERAILTPSKMAMPTLKARIEKSYTAIGEWVVAMCLTALV